MIDLRAPQLPDSVAVSEQDVEVEVGFDATLNGTLLLPSLPWLLQGKPVQFKVEQIRSLRKPVSLSPWWIGFDCIVAADRSQIPFQPFSASWRISETTCRSASPVEYG